MIKYTGDARDKDSGDERDRDGDKCEVMPLIGVESIEKSS
jgi:hypothetical protein